MAGADGFQCEDGCVAAGGEPGHVEPVGEVGAGGEPCRVGVLSAESRATPGAGLSERYVYVISAGLYRHKVGISDNPWKRVRELQTGHYEALRVICALETRWAIEVERTVHLQLRDFRLQGEWFAVGAIDACCAVAGAIETVGSKRGQPFLPGDLVECIRGFEPSESPFPDPVVGDRLIVASIFGEEGAPWLRFDGKHGQYHGYATSHFRFIERDHPPVLETTEGKAP